MKRIPTYWFKQWLTGLACLLYTYEGKKTKLFKNVQSSNNEKNLWQKVDSQAGHRNFVKNFLCYRGWLADFKQFLRQTFYTAKGTQEVLDEFRTKNCQFLNKYLVWQAICSRGTKSPAFYQPSWDIYCVLIWFSFKQLCELCFGMVRSLRNSENLQSA